MAAFFIISGASILVFISLIHMYWACGGSWGSKVVLPMKKGSNEYAFVPRKIGTFAVALFILCFAMIPLAQSGYLSFWNPSRYTRWGCVILAGIFLLRAIGDMRYVGFFKKVKGTKFSVYDTWLYSPLCLYITLSFIVAVFS